MFWNKKKWALEVSYHGSDAQFDDFLAGIAAQHGGTLAMVAGSPAVHGLDFNFSDRRSANAARAEMLSCRPGVIAAGELHQRN